MRITIVKDDNLVIIDQEPLRFDLTDFLPDSFHALQWYDDHGEVEYKNPMVMNASITSLDDYTPIIEAFYRQKESDQNQPEIPKTDPKEQTEESIRNMISETDPMVIRHNEQKELNVPTTMDETEFKQTLAFRESLRKLL